MLPTVLSPLLLGWWLSQASISEAEVFVDRSTFFARAGFSKGLRVGSEAWIVDAQTGSVKGSALVMELWEAMARLNLDEAASAFSGPKRIRFSRAEGEGFCTKPMSGKAQLKGAGAFQKLLLSNESADDWTRCHLLLPTNRAAQVERVPAKSTVEILLVKFHALEDVRVAPLEHVWVECLEGKTKLLMEP